MSGDLGNVTSYNENSCGALSCIVTLQPGESKTILFVLGMDSSEKCAEILASYKNPQEQILQEIETLKADWNGRLDHLQVKTPSPAFNTMINTWNAYNCFITFICPGLPLSSTAVCATDTATVTQCRISRGSSIFPRRWRLKKYVSCCLPR